MSDIVKSNSNKLDIVPFKALPSDTTRANKVYELGVYLDGLLSLTGDKSVQRLEVLLPMVQDLCWSLSIEDVKKAFQMYVKGEMSIEPRDNYLTVILFSKIITEYKQKRQIKIKKIEMPEPTQEEKDALTLMGVVNCFDTFIQTNEIINGYAWVYDHLDELNIIDYSDDTKRKMMPIARERLISISKNELNIDEYKAFKRDLEAKRKGGAVIVEAKKILLKRFFTSLIAKEKHIKDLL